MKFAKKLEAVKAEIGGSVSLSCELSHAKGKVTWSRNGVEIKPSKRFQIREEGTKRTLTITGIRAEDEGEYSCESRDDKSSITIVPKRMYLMVTGWRDLPGSCPQLLQPCKAEFVHVPGLTPVLRTKYRTPFSLSVESICEKCNDCDTY